MIHIIVSNGEVCKISTDDKDIKELLQNESIIILDYDTEYSDGVPCNILHRDGSSSEATYKYTYMSESDIFDVKKINKI